MLLPSWAPLPFASTRCGELHCFYSLTFAHGCIRDLLLDLSRLLGLALRRSRSCLGMPLANLCHAGGRHLRRKPRVELLYIPVAAVVLFHFSLCGATLH